MRYLISAAYFLIRRAVADAGLWSLLERQVLAAAARDELSGPEKRWWVAERLAALPPEVRAPLEALAGWLVNLAVEAMVARLKLAAPGTGEDR